MGLLDRFIKGRGHGTAELARRLGLSEPDLHAARMEYRTFTIPKRGGGERTINAPAPDLKALQRRILRRVLGLLVSHDAAMGFERGRSIVTNARAHTGRAVTVRLDIRNFFATTTAKRVHEFFRKVGWNKPAANLLTRLCTHEGGLPQGAPTSPRLANLVNHLLDARLAAMARAHGAAYTRYADDLCFSHAADDGRAIRRIMNQARVICRDFGYAVHRHKKVHIRRRHQQQRITGLVVNERVNLPRDTCRRLRAIEHRLRTGRAATLNESQLEGWKALRHMIETQRAA